MSPQLGFPEPAQTIKIRLLLCVRTTSTNKGITVKTRSTGISLLSGMLLATPTFAQLSDTAPESISAPKNLGSLFIGQEILIADAGNGFTRKVLLAVRITKNPGAGMRRCDPIDQADSITIEVLDDKTKQVLAVAQRLFGNIKQGETALMREASTHGCVSAQKEMSILGNTLTIEEGYNSPMSFMIPNFGMVKAPARLTFKK